MVDWSHFPTKTAGVEPWATPANAIGLKSCWIYRRHAQQGFGATMNPGEMPKVDFTFHSMDELTKAHQEQAAGG